MSPPRSFISPLPPMCHVVIEGFPLGVGLVKRGQNGYTLVYDYTREGRALGYGYALKQVREFVRSHNRYMGITDAQERACLVGALYGWDKMGARPETWQILRENVGEGIRELEVG